MLKRQTLAQECFAECLGTFILVFFGAGSVAAMVMKGNYDSFWELSVMWGLACALAIYVTGGVTGTHINPAVTICMAIFRGFDKKKIIPYIISQIIGAFLAAAATFGLYFNNFRDYEAAEGIIRGAAESKADAGIFFTFPQDGLSNAQAFIVEAVITALLLIVILAVSDEKNTAAPSGGLSALVIGIAIAVIGGTFGALTGFALNPARDFGPRLFAVLAGWGKVSLPGPGGYFWVPILGPIVGAVAGGWVYEKLIHTFFVKAE